MADTKHIPLSSLQKWMQAVLVTPQGNEHAPPWQHLPESFQQGKLEDIVRPSDRMTARQLVAIYQRSYLARLRECMAGQFKALQYALGEELFRMFADQYLQQYPSTSYTLYDLGERFPQFLNETRPDAEHKEDWPDFMIELAKFEYSINTLFNQKVEDSWGKATVQHSEQELLLSPVIQLVEHMFPICPYYLSFIRGEKPELPFPATTYCVILRQEYRIRLFPLSQNQFHFLKEIEHGSSPAEALKKSTSFSVENWRACRKEWIEGGVFSVKGPNISA